MSEVFGPPFAAGLAELPPSCFGRLPSKYVFLVLLRYRQKMPTAARSNVTTPPITPPMIVEVSLSDLALSTKGVADSVIVIIEVVVGRLEVGLSGSSCRSPPISDAPHEK